MLRSIIFVAIAFELSACSASDKDKYAGRDGKAEAIKDYRAGKPLLIYSHIANGFAPGWASPGLVSCSPEEVGGEIGARVFQVMPEAAFHEGEVRSVADNQLAASAFRFAKAYNTEVLRIRFADVQRVCPHVRIAS